MKKPNMARLFSALAVLTVCFLTTSVSAQVEGACPPGGDGTPRCPEIVVETPNPIGSPTSGVVGYTGTSGAGSTSGGENAPGGMTTAGWDDPSSPRCENEQNAASALTKDFAQFLAGQSLSNKPPGDIIMSGPFNDPAFSDSGWKKYDYNVISSIRSGPTNSIRTTYSVHIHYMYNDFTRLLTQVRYKSSYSAACVGTSSNI